MKVLKTKLVILALACSAFSSFSYAANPVIDQLEEMKAAGLPVDTGAYEREAIYEKQKLSFDMRAEMESQRMIEAVKLQVVEAYDAALGNHKSEQVAREEVINAIMKDLSLADEDLKEELKRISMETLESHMRGEVITTQAMKSAGLKTALKAQSLGRAELMQETVEADRFEITEFNPLQREFESRAELIKSITSGGGNAPYPSSSTSNIKSARQYTTAQSISAQVSMDFLGVKISAGPSISFKKSYSSEATVLAVGMDQILLSNGNFDLHKRDSKNKIIIKNGKEQRREVSFSCSAQVNFSSDYKGEGGFKVMGVGGDASVTQSYSNSVGLDSRRVAIPDYVAGKSVTLSFLAELCHNDFLNAKLKNGSSVKKNLDGIMKNVVASLTFSHPQTKCASDNDCTDWFNNEVISWHKTNTFPRCVPEASGREKFFACALRGLEKSNCGVFEKGKRTSDGSFEYTCDKGLTCKKTKDGGWFTNGELYAYAEGKCVPLNKKTYRAPILDYIEIQFSR